MFGDVVLSPFGRIENSPAMKSNIDMRRELYWNIVLSRGMTMFPGIGETLQGDWSTCIAWWRLFSPKRDLILVGGSIWYHVTFPQMVTKREEYLESFWKMEHKKSSSNTLRIFISFSSKRCAFMDIQSMHDDLDQQNKGSSVLWPWKRPSTTIP